jgi:hypothetical protein
MILGPSSLDPTAKADIEELRRLSGQGDSQGWKFNRDEIHSRVPTAPPPPPPAEPEAPENT